MRHWWIAAMPLMGALAFADECQPANPAAALEAARARQATVIEKPDSLAFIAEARAAGVPATDADYVFLSQSPQELTAEWLDGAGESVGMDCAWSARPESRFGKVVRRWLDKAPR